MKESIQQPELRMYDCVKVKYGQLYWINKEEWIRERDWIRSSGIEYNHITKIGDIPSNIIGEDDKCYWRDLRPEITKEVGVVVDIHINNDIPSYLVHFKTSSAWYPRKHLTIMEVRKRTWWQNFIYKIWK
jgi:hypothetical protein